MRNSRSKPWKSCEIEAALGFSRSLEGAVFLPLCHQMCCGEEDAAPFLPWWEAAGEKLALR